MERASTIYLYTSTTGEVEVQSGADEELSPTHTEAAKGGDGEQHADEDRVDER
jgi:hypothetical protein